MPDLTTESLYVSIDPRRGGKITALRDLRSGREWLLPPAEPYGDPAGYGTSFTDAELSGWDEMAPTITECEVDGPSGPVALPDHGEVWSVPWDTVVVGPRRITLRVDGRTLPFRLDRTVEVTSPDRLRLSYRLWNTGKAAFPSLWAAHPQFVWRRGARVELPSSITEVLDVTSGPDPVVVPWDLPMSTRLDHLGDGEGHKVWTLPGQAPAWCRLRDADGGSVLIEADPDSVPYLGIWWDSCAYADVPVVALEPSTGHYDDLALAAAAGRVPWLDPGDELRWAIELSLEPGE